MLQLQHDFKSMVVKHAEEISTWGAAYRVWHYQNTVLIMEETEETTHVTEIYIENIWESEQER